MGGFPGVQYAVKLLMGKTYLVFMTFIQLSIIYCKLDKSFPYLTGDHTVLLY